MGYGICSECDKHFPDQNSFIEHPCVQDKMKEQPKYESYTEFLDDKLQEGNISKEQYAEARARHKRTRSVPT